jgi:ABC-type phosphate transport system substrate-binding protein
MLARLKLITAALTILFSSSAFADLAIIVNPGYKDGKLNTQDIRKIFLGERRAFPDGLFATPINHNAGSPDRKQFFSSVLGMDETSLLRYWRRQISTGNNHQPVELGSYTAVLNSVASTPGGISYIDSHLVNDKVKVLMVLDKNGIVEN